VYYVYILRSIGDDGLYIGYSANLRKRFRQHVQGDSLATSHRRPWKLIYYETYLFLVRRIPMKHLFLLSFVVVAACCAIAADPPKAKLLAAPRPIKTGEASSRHLAGSGIFVLQLDMATGRVKAIAIQKSTGQPLLDQCAVNALRQWRAAPGTVRTIRLPVIFSANDDSARY
jgi:TonB family protein